MGGGHRTLCRQWRWRNKLLDNAISAIRGQKVGIVCGVRIHGRTSRNRHELWLIVIGRRVIRRSRSSATAGRLIMRATHEIVTLVTKLTRLHDWCRRKLITGMVGRRRSHYSACRIRLRLQINNSSRRWSKHWILISEVCGRVRIRLVVYKRG